MLPTAAESAVELNDGEKLVEFDLHQRVLGRKEKLLLLKHFVVARLAETIARNGNLYGFAVGFYGAGLLNARVREFFAGDERVGNFLKRIQHRSLILERELFARSFGLAILRGE